MSKREEGLKCIKLCQKMLPNATSSFLYKMLRKKNITLNDKRANGSEPLQAGDVIRFYFSDETFDKFHITEKSKNGATKENAYDVSHVKKDLFDEKKDTKLQIDRNCIIYEDQDVILYNKPAGMLSQKAKIQDISINDVLLAYVREKEGENALFTPSICNRLDRNTSGMILFGKSYQGIRCLNTMLNRRSLCKYYHCIVKGQVHQTISLKGYLVKDTKTNKVFVEEKKTADNARIETLIRPLKVGKEMSLLEVHLITGKTHQIRVHLSSIGHPILGDMKYGGQAFARECMEKYGVKYQLLHAYCITFPQTEDCLKALRGKSFEAAKPLKFLQLEAQIAED